MKKDIFYDDNNLQLTEEMNRKQPEEFSPYPPIILFLLFFSLIYFFVGLIWGWHYWERVLAWTALVFIIAMPRYRHGEIGQGNFIQRNQK